MGKSVQALVAFGANLPFEGETPAQTIRRAPEALAKEGLSVLAFSPLYATPCFPAGAGPDYVNAAAVLEAAKEIDASSILQRLHRVEEDFGRIREQRWGMRTLDIDLVALGDSVLPDAAVQDAWRMLPPGAQARVTALLQRFPNEGDLFAQFRERLGMPPPPTERPSVPWQLAQLPAR